jgi:hypothetical protein
MGGGAGLEQRDDHDQAKKITAPKLIASVQGTSRFGFGTPPLSRTTLYASIVLSAGCAARFQA